MIFALLLGLAGLRHRRRADRAADPLRAARDGPLSAPPLDARALGLAARARAAVSAAAAASSALGKRFGGARRAARTSASSSPPASCRGRRPQRRGQDDAAVDPRRRPAPPSAGSRRLRPRRSDRLGAAADRRSTRSSRSPRTCVCSRAWSASPTPTAAVARMLEQTGLRERAGRAARPALGRQPPARERRARAARATRPCWCSMSPRRRSTRRQRERLWSSSTAAARARDERCLLDPRRRPRPSATPTALLVLADGRLLFDGTRRGAARPRRRAPARPTSSSALVSFLGASAGTERAALRALLRKDLLILASLAAAGRAAGVYPIAIALLIGLALSRAPRAPRVAIVNETAAGRDGPGRRAARRRRRSTPHQLFEQVEPVPVSSRAQAIAEVAAGEVLAAVVIPPRHRRAGLARHRRRRSSKCSTTATRSSSRSCARARLGARRRRTSASPSRSSRPPREAIDVLLAGGSLGTLGAPVEPHRARADPARAAAASSPAAAAGPRPRRARTDRRVRRASPRRTSAVSKRVLAQRRRSRSRPHRAAARPPHAAGQLRRRRRRQRLADVRLRAARRRRVALEREEHTLARLRARPGLARGAARREGAARRRLLVRCVAFAMLAGIGIFVPLDWGRAGLWLAALAVGALAFARARRRRSARSPATSAPPRCSRSCSRCRSSSSRSCRAGAVRAASTT